MLPSVSVIIPCYNGSRYLGETIESVLRQTYTDFEIIVVDDGSTDETPEVIARYPDVRPLYQSHAGLSVARNTGLHAARGEYLVFLDSDDRLLPDALKIGVDSLKLHPECAFVYGYWEYINADGSTLPMPHIPRIKKDHYRQFLRQNFIQSIGAAMFRRSAVDGFCVDINSCEDRELYLRIAREHKIHCNGKIVFQYRRHDSNMSGNKERMINASIMLFQAQLEVVRGDKGLERLCRAKIKSLRRELAGKRDLWRDTVNIIKAGGYKLGKLFVRRRKLTR